MTRWQDDGMMKTSFPFALLRWLVVAAVFDWVVTRTITRSAIFMPKPPLVLLAYQVLGWAGQLALSLTSLLVLSTLAWIAWSEWQNRRSPGLPLLLLGQAIFSMVFLFTPPVGWLALVDHLCYLMTLLLIMQRAIRSQNSSPTWRLAQMVACLLPALALLAGRLHQAIPALYTTLQWPGPPPLTGLFFNLGELLIVLSCGALWWAYGRDATWPAWLGAALLALAFVGAHLTNAAMTGILAVWSMGLTLYLPWPLYALSLWCTAVTVIATLRRQSHWVGCAVLLLAASGYAPQLSTQVFLSLIAIWLLATPATQPLPWRGATSRPLAPASSRRLAATIRSGAI